jgi:integrase
MVAAPGARDRALFLLGFAGALRRSELVGLDFGHVTWTGEGFTLLIERSKTDKEGEGAEIAIPRGRSDETCPVVALQSWLAAAEITAGPLFRKVNRGGAVETARLSPDAVRQSQWRAGRGNHGPHAAPQPDLHAQLRPAGKAQPDQPGR